MGRGGSDCRRGKAWGKTGVRRVEEGRYWDAEGRVGEALGRP